MGVLTSGCTMDRSGFFKGGWVVSSFAFAFESAFGPESKCDSGGDVVIVACDRVLLWRLVGWFFQI